MDLPRLPFSGVTPISRHHSVKAAIQAARARGVKTRQYLDLLARVGDASDHEAATALGLPLSSICSIRNGVRNWLWPSDRTAISPYGKTVTCWRLATDAEKAINRQGDQMELRP